jgi:hypothetical protein
MEPPFKPQLSANALDVTNFDENFTKEEAINSVIPEAKMKKVNNNTDKFNDW